MVKLHIQLTEQQWIQAARIVGKFRDVFSEIPGEAREVVHYIATPTGQIVREV